MALAQVVLQKSDLEFLSFTKFDPRIAFIFIAQAFCVISNEFVDGVYESLGSFSK